SPGLPMSLLCTERGPSGTDRARYRRSPAMHAAFEITLRSIARLSFVRQRNAIFSSQGLVSPEKSSLCKLVKHGLSLLQVYRAKPFGEPAVDRSENVARLRSPALIAPKPRHAHRGPKFPGPCLLRPRDRKRSLEIGFCFCQIRLGRQQCNFPCNAIDLGL